MIFEAADGTTAAGHAYVRDYVRGKLASGATPSAVLDAFCMPPEDEIDEDSLVRTVLASVQRRQDFDLGRELVAAASAGHAAEVDALLTAGAPWDALDASGHSAGAHALRGGHDACVARLCAAGAACMLADFERRAPNAAGPFAGATNYQQQRLRYEGGATAAAAERLVDENDRPVMMRWELALMEAHAAAMQPAGRSVLNVGFGLGLIDRCLQSRRPKAHHIVECHPDVLAAMQQEGWASKPGVRILQGRWQDVLPGGATYDAIFWDTFGESVDELFEFMALLPTLLNPGGTFSYFNGIASHDEFLHRVYGDAACQRLAALGLRLRFEAVPVEVDERTFAGVEGGRNWWALERYLLPIAELT